MNEQPPEQELAGQVPPTGRTPDDRLPAGALLRFEQVSLGRQVYANYRWILYQDGRWHLGRNRTTYSGGKGPFESDLPASPTKVLPAAVVREVEEQLRAADFLRQESQSDPRMRDGARLTITARLDGQAHEVTYEGVRTPLSTYLAGFAWRHEAGGKR